MAADRILDRLNDTQREAVTHAAAPLLTIAGAGTGKTTVITRRIAWLIAQKKARPEEILALTFTDKAAAEMEERVDTLVPYGYADVEIATFHAFGDRLLREHALELGLQPDFRVLNRAEQAIVFRDQIVHALRLLRVRPYVLAGLQRRFKYILVDEFQDTNWGQFEIVKLLGARHGNVACVADDDQSIYKWRGAAISNVLGFLERYPEARQVVLTENYRSHQPILDSAYRLIKNNNPDRLEVKYGITKHLTAVKQAAGRVPTHLHLD